MKTECLVRIMTVDCRESTWGEPGTLTSTLGDGNSRRAGAHNRSPPWGTGETGSLRLLKDEP
jgi:hypothetical protein